PPAAWPSRRRASSPALLEARRQRAMRAPVEGDSKAILMLPGSRSSEIAKLLPFFEDAAKELVARNGTMRFLLPTVPHN
ncbi:lipid-A-disaccharide synthase, partial [Rhizobium leguminosarum]